MLLPLELRSRKKPPVPVSVLSMPQGVSLFSEKSWLQLHELELQCSCPWDLLSGMCLLPRPPFLRAEHAQHVWAEGSFQDWVSIYHTWTSLGCLFYTGHMEPTQVLYYFNKQWGVDVARAARKQGRLGLHLADHMVLLGRTHKDKERQPVALQTHA